MNRLHAAGKIVPRSRRSGGAERFGSHRPQAFIEHQSTQRFAQQKSAAYCIGRAGLPAGPIFADLSKIGKDLRFAASENYSRRQFPRVISAVDSGIADAAIAFSSDTPRAENCQTYFRIPHHEVAAKYVGGIIRSSKRPQEARHLSNFIISREACAKLPQVWAPPCWSC